VVLVEVLQVLLQVRQARTLELLVVLTALAQQVFGEGQAAEVGQITILRQVSQAMQYMEGRLVVMAAVKALVHTVTALLEEYLEIAHKQLTVRTKAELATDTLVAAVLEETAARPAAPQEVRGAYRGVVAVVAGQP
jgi:hypothetical protein